MKYRSTYGWLNLVIGLLLIALSVVSFTRPVAFLTSLVVLYGLAAVITGIVDIVFYCRMERHIGFGPTVSLISGILSVMTGFMLLVYPGAGRWALTLLFPLWFIAHCISRLSHLNFLRFREGRGYYYFVMVINILGLVLGCLMLLSPRLSMLSMNAVIGAYLLLLGIDCVAEALWAFRE